MQIAHLTDLHYCEKHLEFVDRATGFAVRRAIELGCEAAVLSGDSFDAAVPVHHPAVHALMDRVGTLADAMPVLVLQGTQSHDRPGCLELFKRLRSAHPIHVAASIHQAALCRDGEGWRWQASEGFAFNALPPATAALFSCLPSVNRGAVAASTSADTAGADTANLVHDVCRGWSGINLLARRAGLPTVLVSHGTVNGCVTESRNAMVSPDHEFTTGTLFAAETAAVCLGHIHAHQQWEQDGRRIAYGGSIARLVYGHDAPVGFLVWNVEAERADCELHETPARRLIDLFFDGPPDMAAIQNRLADLEGAYVRLRYSVDQEHAHGVDAGQIKAMLTDAGAAEVKVEPRIDPVQRPRAAGLNQIDALADKVARWADLSDTPAPALIDRLALLVSCEPAAIVAQLCDPDQAQEAA
ncbi:MAG: hypothetical protein L0H83_15040 [Salinisphaera sp.]|nr:hypothetical protein [Salinisphaera sp.]